MNEIHGFFKTQDDIYSFVSFESQNGIWCIAQSETRQEVMQANSELAAAQWLGARLKATIYFTKKD